MEPQANPTVIIRRKLDPHKEIDSPMQDGERAFTLDGEIAETKVRAVVVSCEDNNRGLLEIDDDLMFVNSYFDVERRSWQVLLVSRTATGPMYIRARRQKG